MPFARDDDLGPVPTLERGSPVSKRGDEQPVAGAMEIAKSVRDAVAGRREDTVADDRRRADEVARPVREEQLANRLVRVLSIGSEGNQAGAGELCSERASVVRHSFAAVLRIWRKLHQRTRVKLNARL